MSKSKSKLTVTQRLAADPIARKLVDDARRIAKAKGVWTQEFIKLASRLADLHYFLKCHHKDDVLTKVTVRWTGSNK